MKAGDSFRSLGKPTLKILEVEGPFVIYTADGQRRVAERKAFEQHLKTYEPRKEAMQQSDRIYINARGEVVPWGRTEFAAYNAGWQAGTLPNLKAPSRPDRPAYLGEIYDKGKLEGERHKERFEAAKGEHQERVASRG